MKCQKCGQEIHPHSKNCFYCGAPQKKGLSTGAVVGITLGSIALAIVLAISSCFACVSCAFGSAARNNKATSSYSSKSEKVTEATEKETVTEPPTKKPTEAKSEETSESLQEKRYINEATWADTANYMFAVEIDDFNGDIFEAGTYRFYPKYVINGRYYVPVVWDAYVSYNQYNSLSELQESELTAVCGGNDGYEAYIELSKGQYVYIIYNDTALTPTGALQIEKQ